MNNKIEKLLHNKGDNYIFPFFWLHGEEETTLREYMKAIDESNIKAVCVESRPHPDYCGPKWWADMDIILDEARKRNMKVWILDDSHFPTGYANGAMEHQPDERRRQSICCRIYQCTGKEALTISRKEILHPDEFIPSQIEQMLCEKESRSFDDDRLLGVFAIRMDEKENGFLKEAYRISLIEHIKNDELCWKIPEGNWNVYVLHLSRNRGYHRNYINMMDASSCKVLLDAVYEPHYAHYKDDFGKTIAGFFSDEPELGNGHMFEQGVIFGDDTDFPWSTELEEILKAALGTDFAQKLTLLWENEADADEKAKVRYLYMDAVTKLVEKDFSWQLGTWCRERGVKYIGHLIEDNNQHARTGSSLGHFYRGLAGQDMSGIDDIGGQVLPQGEDLDYDKNIFNRRIGEFYHYMLGKLASSAAAIEPWKHGDSMCEIFGAYGWSEGVRLEKYLIDHFLVRGINHYVPHAFSAKEFPDPDCPPHFYAHGNNPQYRHFGSLMAYTNRVCELISDGRHVAPAAILYHGEGEWTGDCMFSHKVGHVLADAQIEYDYIPQDVFANPETFQLTVDKGMLKIHTQEYKVFLIPATQYVTKAFAEYVNKMEQAGILILFVDAYPTGICDIEDAFEIASLIANMEKCRIVKLDDIVPMLWEEKIADITIAPANNRIRYYHYEHKDGATVYLFVNEGTKVYKGRVELVDDRSCYIYNAWENCLEEAEYDGMALSIELEPLKSRIVLFDTTGTHMEEVAKYKKIAVKPEGNAVDFTGEWKRSICRSVEYPDFNAEKIISLPDTLEQEEPKFSGFVRYENTFDVSEYEKVVLEISDAQEGVEVFVNTKNLGIQIVPPFLYDITQAVQPGKNRMVIEVATTLEREMGDKPNLFGQIEEVTSRSGITGEVRVYQE